MRTEDGYIIRKCLDGDPAAFGLLVDKYRSSLYALAYSKLGNFHDAQDIAQEAFIKAYRKLHTLRRSDNFLAWLYAITSNLCKNWIRAKSRRPDREFVEDQDPKSLDQTSINSYQENLVRESLHEALDSLPEIYREVLSLYYLGGMSVKEIAKFLGISPNTIIQRLNRGRLKLKEETLIMMTATFNQYKLQPAFTFRIVEMVKRIGVLPRAPWLPWGLSLVTGTVLTLLGLISYPILLNPNVNLISSDIPIEAQVLDIGEIPVDVAKISDVPVISNRDGNFDGRGVLQYTPYASS
jgi:RNA polymerase sigma factor (sigma-70 family)